MHNIYSTVHPTLLHCSMATEKTHRLDNNNVTLLEFSRYHWEGLFDTGVKMYSLGATVRQGYWNMNVQVWKLFACRVRQVFRCLLLSFWNTKVILRAMWRCEEEISSHSSEIMSTLKQHYTFWFLICLDFILYSTQCRYIEIHMFSVTGGVAGELVRGFHLLP